jgi:hypothetical protein
MPMRFVLILPILSVLVSACGGVSAVRGEGETTTTVTTEPAVEDCAAAVRPEVLVTSSTSGFAPPSTIVVWKDGRAGSGSQWLDEAKCFTVAPATLAELREALDEADLARVPHCERARAEPGMVIETDTRTVDYGDLSISVTEPCAGPPPHVQRLFDLLVALPPG